MRGPAVWGRFIAAAAAAAVILCPFARAEDLRIGTTFSARQCEYLGMDWKEAYMAVLEQGFDIIRLGAYWDEIEKEKGHYDFSDLDWLVARAGERNVPVVIAAGIKAPRWPEYFMPAWLEEKADPAYASDLAGYPHIRESVLKFLAEVVKRYRDEPAVRYWQVENEPFIRIGRKNWYISADLLREEVALVRELDPENRPVIMTIATYPHWLMRTIARIFTPYDRVRESAALCDIIGINVYPLVGHRMLWSDMYLEAGERARIAYFERLVRLIQDEGKQVWVTELQAEPWEPGHLAYTGENIPKSDRPELTEKVFRELRGMGVETFLLWGTEYWLFREERYGDERWKAMAEGLFAGKKRRR